MVLNQFRSSQYTLSNSKTIYDSIILNHVYYKFTNSQNLQTIKSFSVWFITIFIPQFLLLKLFLIPLSKNHELEAEWKLLPRLLFRNTNMILIERLLAICAIILMYTWSWNFNMQIPQVIIKDTSYMQIEINLTSDVGQDINESQVNISDNAKQHVKILRILLSSRWLYIRTLADLTLPKPCL